MVELTAGLETFSFIIRSSLVNLFAPQIFSLFRSKLETDELKLVSSYIINLLTL
jgi:hypothetical protein